MERHVMVYAAPMPARITNKRIAVISVVELAKGAGGTETVPKLWVVAEEVFQREAVVSLEGFGICELLDVGVCEDCGTVCGGAGDAVDGCVADFVGELVCEALLTDVWSVGTV
jgi:hypothetical protein